jgi:hypothetical protein
MGMLDWIPETSLTKELTWSLQAPWRGLDCREEFGNIWSFTRSLFIFLSLNTKLYVLRQI